MRRALAAAVLAPLALGGLCAAALATELAEPPPIALFF
jgi:hypothetical protein